MGEQISAGRTIRNIAICIAALAVAGCDENGDFAFPAGSNAEIRQTGDRGTTAQDRTVEQDVERPDIFAVTDRGLWDGRPSLGGVWVAHPDVAEPERVIIRNPTNGQSVIGALFRRERENPGPALQISSDAADALGILAGAPTEVSVVVMRRQEVTVAPEPAESAAIAALDAPVTVQETPLDPIAGAASAIAAAETAAPAVVPAPETTAQDAAQDAAPADPPALSGPLIQIGVFSIEANADRAAETLRAAGIATQVLPQQAGGRMVWRVVSGPSADAESQAAMLAQIKELGFVDAFGFEA